MPARAIVGMEETVARALDALAQQLPLLLEGEAGTGKTELVKALSERLGLPYFRVDGEPEVTSTKLYGWFDPPIVLAKGYVHEAFVPGNLVRAMQEGGLFFFNEVNRAPSEALNAVLAGLDEREVYIPKIGLVVAHESFRAVFTANSLDHIGTNPLPAAFYDRCVLLQTDHLPLEQAEKIVVLRTGEVDGELVRLVCLVVELSRRHPQADAGGSIRAAISMVKLLRAARDRGKDPFSRQELIACAQMSMAKVLRLRYDAELSGDELLGEVVDRALGKKK